MGQIVECRSGEPHPYSAKRKSMKKFTYSTKVKALANQPFTQSDVAAHASHDEPVLNPASNAGRSCSDRRLKKGLSKPSQSYIMATLNCRTLQSASSQAELEKLMQDCHIAITCIQEHRFVHSESDPAEVARKLGTTNSTTLFTASAVRNECGASIRGVGIAINSKILPLLLSVKKMDERIIVATFKGNPKTVVISCHSPHNARPEEEVVNFYNKLSNVVEDIPPHAMLLIGGDMNAQIAKGFSIHDTTNRNGQLFIDFIEQHNFVIGNTSFQKSTNKLWTFRSPKGDLSQIDFCIYRKRWRNSIKDCQAYSTSNPIGSDHRIVSATVKLSLRRPKQPVAKKLFWQALTSDSDLATRVDDTIDSRFQVLSPTKQDYTTFVSLAIQTGTDLLPPKPGRPPKTVEMEVVVSARKATLRASTKDIQTAQNKLRNTFDSCEDKRISDTLHSFENPASTTAALKNAWDLVKELSGKRSRSVIFIEGEDRLKTWENHFKTLLNADPATQAESDIQIEKVFDIFSTIKCGELSQTEVDASVRLMKNGKAPGLDGLPPEFWKLPKVKKSLRKFCNATYIGNRPKEWGISGLTPIPKKGDLKKTDNYRGISLTQVASKIFNRCLLNRIRPVIDEVLRPNQNGFRQGRSTTSHILALRRIVEELKNYDKEAILTFIDFRKAFDSIDRVKMFLILEAYGIPPDVVKAIKVTYEETSAIVITPEGETNAFTINTGVLQGDPLAPFLFIICLDYALRFSITESDGLTLNRRRSRRHPAEVIADLDYADDIALLEDSIESAQELLNKVEKACQHIGLFLNVPKTKYMHLNPSSDKQLFSSDGSPIELVKDFKYLGGYMDTEHDMNTRIAQAWGAIHSLQKVWKAPIKKETKTKVFQASIETILLYGSDSWTLNVSRCKKLDGTYTRMLRTIYNISWREHYTNKSLYGNLSRISLVVNRRRLALAGHVTRHDELAGKLLLWTPDAKRRVGRPYVTIKALLEKDTGLSGRDLLTAMKDRKYWCSNFVNASPPPEGIG